MRHFNQAWNRNVYNCRSLKHCGKPPAITVDAAAPAYDRPHHILNVRKYACLTVDRLYGTVRKHWPAAIETMHHYGAGVRLRFRSDIDESLFTAVILGAWERAHGFTGTVEVARD